ncbi:hypothetical protein OG292_19825 [Streptomyces sp. NBC_01511]|uniref:hypothetical protein n=1 Tax=Streptomyces sp. NBC_01511 TaxID=2903889 RepID=UPI00386ED916
MSSATRDPYPVIRFRCTTRLHGFEQTATMDLKRAVWDRADEPWRAEYLTSVRERYGAWLWQETGVTLSDDQLAALPVIEVGPEASASH